MQTLEGAKKTAATNKRKYGKDYYAKIGAQGGKKKNSNKGFGSATPEQRRELGRKGGLSRWNMAYEDLHTKAETKKRVYSPSNTRVDSNSVSSPISKLSSAFNRVVRK